MSERGYCRFSNGETRAYATATTPSGILASVLKALEHHGVDREQLPAGVDIDQLERDFAAIDRRAFERLLSAAEFHGPQIVVVESSERTGKGVVSRMDQGTTFGLIA